MLGGSKICSKTEGTGWLDPSNLLQANSASGLVIAQEDLLIHRFRKGEKRFVSESLINGLFTIQSLQSLGSRILYIKKKQPRVLVTTQTVEMKGDVTERTLLVVEPASRKLMNACQI